MKINSLVWFVISPSVRSKYRTLLTTRSWPTRKSQAKANAIDCQNLAPSDSYSARANIKNMKLKIILIQLEPS